MSIRIVRLGTPRAPGEYARRYRKEMSKPQARHLIELLVALSRQSNVSVGCYCEDATRCHRSLLRELLVEAGASIADGE